MPVKLRELNEKLLAPKQEHTSFVKAISNPNEAENQEVIHNSGNIIIKDKLEKRRTEQKRKDTEKTITDLLNSTNKSRMAHAARLEAAKKQAANGQTGAGIR